ncbi:MAG: hypothetical protein ACRECE_10805 [Xanthobacteraceae bacterium]
MLGDSKLQRWRDRSRIAIPLALALLASGCSGSSSFFGGPTASTPAGAAAPAPTSSPSDKWLPADITDLFAGSSDKAPQPVAGATQPNLECPYIQIRAGASTLIIDGPGENSAMSLKYQGTFVRAARQCSVVAGQMVMKVGVEGRIILGPQGGPGVVNVPLRIAIVDDTPSSSKTILTKLIIIPVAVQSADDSPIFTHVEDNLSFPLPSAATLDNYIVYIGFDPIAAETPKHERPKPRYRRKPKPRPAPTG